VRIGGLDLRLRILPALLVLLALAGGWAYLFWQTQEVDARRHNRAVALLRELQQLETQRDLAVLRVRLDLTAHYDALVQPLPRIDGILAELRQHAQAGDGDRAAVAAVEAMRAALDDKADMVDRFQRHDSLLKNSLQYVPQAHGVVRALLQEPGAGALQARLGELMGTTLGFVAAPDDASRGALLAAMQQARLAAASQPLPLNEALGNLLLHVDVVLQRRAAEDEVLAGMAQAGVPARLEAVRAALARQFEAQLRQQAGFQYGLLYLSGFAVLAIAAAVAWQLWRSSTEVRRMGQLVERTRAELRESQTLLIHAEKMSLLGEVVAGIAHEINTPLAYLRSGLQSVRENLQAVLQPALRGGPAYALEVLDETRGLVEDGLEGAQQIDDTIVNLLKFSRLDRSKVVVCRIENSLETTLRLASHLLKNKKLVRRYGGTAEVECDLPQINQVFLNLLKNAAQATPQTGGEIVVTTGMAGPDTVRVDVNDNGPGIAPEVRLRIFEPFFSTRDDGNGLGLSISQTIVQAHGGWIEVDSHYGSGTRFSVLLPVAKPAQSADLGRRSAAA